jgi:hypothetical protein
MSSAHITPPYLRYMMMLTTLLLVAFPLVLFLQIFQFKLCVLQISNVLGTYHNPPPPPTLLFIIEPIILPLIAEQYKLWPSSLCSFIPVTCCFLGPYVLAPYSETPFD